MPHPVPSVICDKHQLMNLASVGRNSRTGIFVKPLKQVLMVQVWNQPLGCSHVGTGF